MTQGSPHFLFIPVGSSGDVHPFLGIAQALHQRGHDVTVISAETFRRATDQCGLQFIPYMTDEEFQQIVSDLDLWHPRKGLRVILGRMAEHLRGAYDRLCDVYQPDRTVIVAASLAFAARVLQDKHAAPVVSMHVAPSAFRTLHLQPTGVPGQDLSWLPKPLKQLMWWVLDRALLDPNIAPAINRLRADIGLPAISRPFKDWLHSPNRTIGLFPPWFGPPQPDWPEQARLTGFPLFDERGQHELNPGLERFLDGGTPPIVFTPGSAHSQAGSFFATAIEATAIMQRRCLLLTRYPEQVPRDIPDYARHEAYVPFSSLLPRCAAIVHHGGVGTCAQGLAAGIPQLTMPMGFDQPDNATRLHRLGVGFWVVPKKFTGKRVAEALERILADKGIHESCSRWKSEMAAGDPVAETCELIEEIARSRTV